MSPLAANPGPHNLTHLPYTFSHPQPVALTSPTRLAPPPPLSSPSSPPLPPFVTPPYHLAYLHSWPLMGSSHPSHPPEPIPPLDFQSEQQLLFDVLGKSGRGFRLFTSHATTQQLLKLLTVGCRVLHYSGHGMSTCLAFESDAGDMQKVDASTLHQMMTAAGDGGVQLAFVSACHSESTADAFLRAGVRHVIAVKAKEKIHDQAACAFLSMFYFCLCKGNTVRVAFSFAKVAVQANPIHQATIEDNKFLLLPPDGDHDVAIFGDGSVPPGAWTDLSAPETVNNLRALPELFVSRNAEMQEIVLKVVKKKKKMLTLTGPVGVGKTALALAAATYMCTRHLFDGVYFIDLGLLLSRPSATLATLVSEAMQLPTTFNHTLQLLHFLKTERRHCCFLFIFDQAELAFAYDDQPANPRCLSSFLSALFSSTQSRALLTSLDPLGAVRSDSASQAFHSWQEGLLQVGPLSPGDALKLFFNLKPRDIDYTEFGAPSRDSRAAARALIQHPVLLAIEGRPKRIWRVEEMLGRQGMRMHEQRLMDAIHAMIEEEKEEERRRRSRYRRQGREAEEAEDAAALQLSQQPDPNVQGNAALASTLLSPPSLPVPHPVPGVRAPSLALAFWTQFAGGAGCVSYAQLEPALQQHFIRTAGTPSRPLSSEDLLVVRHKMEQLTAAGGGGSRGLVTVDTFTRFWEWFYALELTVQRCRHVWTWQHAVVRAPGDARPLPSSVYALHGFLQREQSTALLQGMAEEAGCPKPFLLRLSESQSGCLTVCWLKQGQVHYTLVHIDAYRSLAAAAAAARPPPAASFTIEVDGGGKRTFDSLSALIMEYPPFRTLYPNIPKAQVFGRTGEAEQEEQEEDQQEQEEEAEGERQGKEEADDLQRYPRHDAHTAQRRPPHEKEEKEERKE